MPNLEVTTTSPYESSNGTITVAGTADAGATVQVILIPRPTKPLVAEDDFAAEYDKEGLLSKGSAVARSVQVPEGPVSPPSWSIDVPVDGLVPGTQYVLYATDGKGKIVMIRPVEFS